MPRSAPPDCDPSARPRRRAPFLRLFLWLLAVAVVLSVVLAAAGAMGLFEPALVRGIVLVIVLVAAPLGVVVARTPATVGPAWAALLARLGRLVGVGVLAGVVVTGAMWAVFGILEHSGPDINPSRIAREAWEMAGVGGAFGFALALVVWLVALPGALWARRRGPVTEAPPRWGLAASFGAAGMVGVIAGCEALLSNDLLVSGCSSGCPVFAMGEATRTFGAVIATAAIVGAAVLVRAAPVRGSARHALGALACTTVALASLTLSYTVYSWRWGAFPHRQWLFLELERGSSRTVLSRASRVEVEEGTFGRVLVVHQPDGSVASIRLSFGGFGFAEPDNLVDVIHTLAEEL